MESTLVKKFLKVVEMTTKDLEYHINIVDKAAAGFEMLYTSYEKLLWINVIKQHCMLQRNHS